MASLTIFRATESAGVIPHRGTLPASANTLYPKGAMVCRTAAGLAYNPVTADVAGNPAIGVVQATIDNRTNSDLGGLDSSVDVEIEYGVFGFDINGTAPVPGDKVYVFDNHTVTLTVGSTRGVAGRVIEVRNNANGVLQAYVYISPLFAEV
jgi:hypothetical protein